MEGRRKALGLRRQTSGKDVHVKEETPKKAANVASRRSEEKALTKDKDSSSTLSNCITSDQRTPKRRIQVFQSPRSPGLETVFPRMLGSPEIEVSWDWGCSQVPKDMLPSRLVKGKSPKQPPVILSPLIQEPRVFQSRQMSEEENQARLAFYKNVLSQASKCNIEADSKGDCELQTANSFGNECNSVQPNPSTPKRCKKPFAAEREKLNELFDDSANEFMLECSQMVEEQLKNGQINVGPVVSIKIPNRKHDLSPDCEPDNVHKRACLVKSKLNLFSEVPKGADPEPKTDTVEEHTSPKRGQLKHHSNSVIKSNVINSNGERNPSSKNSLTSNTQNNLNTTTNNLSHITNRENVSNTKESTRTGSSRGSIPELPKHPIGNVNSSALERRLPNIKQELTHKNNTVKPNNIVQTNYAKENMNNNRYDSVDKFRRNSKGLCHSNQNQNVYRGNQASKNVKQCLSTTAANENGTDDENEKNKSTYKELTNKAQEPTQKADDFTALLDDGFDMELSSLDVDSICSNTQVPVVPKVCTKAEIEAKRLAALQRLKMKIKR